MAHPVWVREAIEEKEAGGHPKLFEDKPTQLQRDIDYHTEQLIDLKACLNGDRTSKRWQELKVEFDRIQARRKHEIIWSKERDAFPNARYIGGELTPENWDELVPDI